MIHSICPVCGHEFVHIDSVERDLVGNVIVSFSCENEHAWTLTIKESNGKVSFETQYLKPIREDGVSWISAGMPTVRKPALFEILEGARFAREV